MNDCGSSRKSGPDDLLGAVREFADLVLEKSRMAQGSQPTPLLVDCLHVETHEPFRAGTATDPGDRCLLSNFAHQQVFTRVLDALTTITGRAKYREAGLDTARYVLTNLRRNGLIFWGGHAAFDLDERTPIFVAEKGQQHELKCHYPHYALMWEADAAETQAFIEAFWQSHVIDWSVLDFNRHGSLRPGADKRTADPWRRPYVGGEVFFEGEGLTFINTGSDLFYAAAMLYHFSAEEGPLDWAKRLAHRYVETRSPETGMGGYQISRRRWTEQSAAKRPLFAGDRAQTQFAKQFPEHHPLEGTLSCAARMQSVFGYAGLCRMLLAETLGEAGEELGQWAIEDLRAYGTHAYAFEDNTFHPCFTDGFRLTGQVIAQDGYYGKEGDAFETRPVNPTSFLAYATGWRLSRDPLLWRILRNMASHSGLGDIGESPSDEPSWSESCTCADPYALFVLLELHKALPEVGCLDAALRVGKAILSQRLCGGLFVPDTETEYVGIDAVEPLALLHLAAHLMGRSDALTASLIPLGVPRQVSPADMTWRRDSGFGN